MLSGEVVDEFFEDGAHGMVVNGGGGEVDFGVGSIWWDGGEEIGLGEGGDLVAEI